jgi:DNA (cytosine-5)-methyltransferase 1
VGTCGADDNQAQAGHLVPEVADPISASEGKTYSHEGAHNFQLHNVVSVAENQRGEIVTGDVSHAVSSGGSKPGSGYPCVAHALTSEGHDASAEIVSEGSPSLTTSHDGPPICMAPSFSKRPGQQIATRDDGSSFAVTTGEPPRLAGAEMAVRRLTPRECERLQGMPDDHTLIEWKGKPAPDGKRYAAIGNSMAVNVMRFIGERIAVVEGLSI